MNFNLICKLLILLDIFLESGASGEPHDTVFNNPQKFVKVHKTLYLSRF